MSILGTRTFKHGLDDGLFKATTVNNGASDDPPLDTILLIACLYTPCLSTRENAGRVKCPMDPYFIIPDRCLCVDFQTLRLQEAPDAVPHGEMPRHLQLYCDR